MKRILFILGLVLLPLSFVSAGTEHNMTGWAWSSNVGWISFNCTNVSIASCTGVNYGVTINPTTNKLSGFAWSPNIGWIQFGALSGFPSGSGTFTGDAEKNGSTLRGWARALSNGDGWDGWISLGGTNYSVIASSSGAFLGYGWGSDVVGWTSFNTAGDDGVRLGGGANLIALKGGVPFLNGAVFEYNSSVDLSSELINMPEGQTCTLSKTSTGGTPFTTIPNISTTTATSTGILVTNGNATTTYSYELNCTNGQVSSISFDVKPQQPGFSFGGPTSVDIQFLSAGTTTSKDMAFRVDPVGGFVGDVSVSVSSISPALDASTTATYFMGDASEPTRVYQLSPVQVLHVDGTTEPATSAGFILQLRVSQPFPALPQKSFIVTAVSGGETKTKVVTVNPTAEDPRYQEF